MAGDYLGMDGFPSDWPVVRLGDVAAVKGGKRLPAGAALTPNRTNHPYLRIVDFKNGRIDKSALLYVPDEVFPRIARYTISAKDIYVSIVGTIGLVGIVDEDLDGANLTENAAKICNIADNVDRDYLAAFLRSGWGQYQIHALTVGSTQPKLALFRVEDICFPLPPLPEQRAIAHILGTLDDKIELNRRMSETLEAMARALFKAWFVDFDPVRAKLDGRWRKGQSLPGLPAHLYDLFPARLVPSELGEIPEGWRVAAVGDHVHCVKGKSYKSEDLQEDSNTALVTLKSFARGGGYRPDGLKSYTGDFRPEQVLRPGELIIACTDVTQAAEVIGKPAIVRTNDQFTTLVASLDVLVVRPKDDGMRVSFLYCLFRSDEFSQHAYAHSTGTTVLHLDKDAVRSFRFALPPAEVVRAFACLAERLFQRVDEAERESRTLAALRDALLPKLISGELRVKDAERFLQERGL